MDYSVRLARREVGYSEDVKTGSDNSAAKRLAVGVSVMDPRR